MNRLRAGAIWAGALLILAGGCASGPEQGPRGQGPAAGLNQSQMLLSRARTLQREKGCARAAPTYRVVASFGADYEVAQYELGACLLDMEGANADETALFREEGLLWIKRAAWGGNARAQHRLAHLLSGAGYEPARGIAADPQAAMGWALVYRENPARALYALPDVAEPVLAHLQGALSEEESAAAGAGRRGPPGGQRPRRRQADAVVIAEAP